jgi:hypothetical protein
MKSNPNLCAPQPKLSAFCVGDVLEEIGIYGDCAWEEVFLETQETEPPAEIHLKGTVHAGHIYFHIPQHFTSGSKLVFDFSALDLFPVLPPPTNAMDMVNLAKPSHSSTDRKYPSVPSK